MITDDLIEDILLNYREDQEKMTTELIKQAKDHGGKDNVSVMLAKVIKEFPSNTGWFSKFFDIFS